VGCALELGSRAALRPPGPREPPASPTDADKGRWVRLWIATWHSAARDTWGAGSEPRRGESKYVTKWALITLGPLGASVSSVFRGKLEETVYLSFSLYRLIVTLFSEQYSSDTVNIALLQYSVNSLMTNVLR
jgi:hypothetical protein